MGNRVSLKGPQRVNKGLWPSFIQQSVLDLPLFYSIAASLSLVFTHSHGEPVQPRINGAPNKIHIENLITEIEDCRRMSYVFRRYLWITLVSLSHSATENDDDDDDDATHR